MLPFYEKRRTLIFFSLSLNIDKDFRSQCKYRQTLNSFWPLTNTRVLPENIKQQLQHDSVKAANPMKLIEYWSRSPDQYQNSPGTDSKYCSGVCDLFYLRRNRYDMKCRKKQNRTIKIDLIGRFSCVSKTTECLCVFI